MKNLEQWEQWLIPFFGVPLRIIGEIPLSYRDMEEMGELVKSFIVEKGINKATTRLVNNYPHVFITLMSSFAAYNDQQNFWDAFAKFIGTEHQNLSNYVWRHHYVELAEKFGLKVFTFSDDRTPYVTTIRFQGGIPTYSLPDYFEYMVLPAVQREGLREVEPTKALEYLISHIYSVDSPVLDFLENSGELGIEFFSESCRMARYALTHHNDIIAIDEVDLPPYVVYAFEDFLEQTEDEKQHWRKPELLAAPYSEDAAVILHLPEQEINLELFTRKIQWLIEIDGHNELLEIPCTVFRQRENIVTKESFHPIQGTTNLITVSIHAISEETKERQELRSWNLPLVPAPGKTPLLAFNAAGQRVFFTTGLPAEPLYLLIPVNSELAVQGESHRIEELIPLVGSWRDWKMEFWNLTNAWSLKLSQADKSVAVIIPILGTLPQPELCGGHKFQFQDHTELPLYTSEIPSLSVPVSNIYGNDGVLDGWQMRIHSLWESAPNIDRSFKLSQYQSQIQIINDRAILPLSVILGDKPAGMYQINVRGPRDIKAEFRFRTWPRVMVLDLETKLRKPDVAAKPSIFILRLQEHAECELQPGMESVEINQNAAGWEITAPSELNRVLLHLTMTNEQGGMVRVPVTIPLPKLRWGLATDLTLGDLKLDRHKLVRSIDQLLQSGTIAIHVEMYGLGNLIHSIRLRLVDLGETETVTQEANFAHTDFTKDWLRAGLGQFRDSIMQINSLGQFELAYWSAENTIEPIRIPLLEISREIKVENVKLEQVDETSWKILWHEDQPLKNRRFLILPAWQPWQKPWEYKIPNEAIGEMTINGISLPPSRYHLYFYIKPTWDEPIESPPENLSPFVVDLCNPRERIKAIDVIGATANDKFKCLMEQAVIFDTMENPEKSGELLSEAAKHLFTLTNLNTLLGSLKWIQKHEIEPPAIKSFFIKSMFHLRILETVFGKYDINNPSVIEYLKFTGTFHDSVPANSAKLLLTKVDDPTVIYSCLHSLLKRKDNDLLSIIVKMMQQARLSRRDALEILYYDPLWAIEKVTELEKGQYVDKLISDLLPKVAHLNHLKNDPRIIDWMVRAIPYEEDSQVVQAYIEHLFSNEYIARFEILVNAKLTEKVTDEFVKKMLALEPKTLITILAAHSENGENQKWVEWLKQFYPGTAGIIIPGAILKTPFGNAKVEFIEKINNRKIDQVHLGDQESTLTLFIDEGIDKIRIIINFREMNITIPGLSYVWKCKICEFMHPTQRIVDKHTMSLHGKRFLEQIPLPYPFSSDQIEPVL